jgi:hypothetical protein
LAYSKALSEVTHLGGDKPDYTLGSILNKILLSRGAPKEKYFTTPTKINIIYHCCPVEIT